MANLREIFSEYTQNPDHHVGAILRIRMDYHRLKQNDIARKAGLTNCTLSKILNGVNRPKLPTVEKIESAIRELACENTYHTA